MKKMLLKYFLLTALITTMLLSCNHKSKTAQQEPIETDTVITLLQHPPKDFSKIIAAVKDLIPQQFHFSSDTQAHTFTVTVNPLKLFVLKSLDDGRKAGGINVIDISVKDKDTKDISYKLLYEFKPLLSAADLQKIIDFDDTLDVRINELSQKYKHSDLWLSSMNFKATDKALQQEYDAYHKERDSIAATFKKRPDFTSGGYSVFISDNKPVNCIVFDNRKSSAIAQMKMKQEEMLKDN